MAVFDSIPERRVILDVIAPVVKTDTRASTITAQAVQYIPIAPDHLGKKGTLPVIAEIPNSARYTNGKPNPSEKTVVHMYGYLSDLQFKNAVRN